MKFKDIVNIANNVKSYVEKQHKLPAKIDGVSKADYSYLFTKSVLNPGKDITLVHYKEAPNPKGDTILKTFTKKEYTDIAKDINKFLSNKRFPNYDTYQNKKISIDLIIYCFAKAIVFYLKNKRLPNSIGFNSNVFMAKQTSQVKITPNEVYNYFIKVFGKVTTIDEALQKVKEKGYSYYYDDVYTNKNAIDRIKAGKGINCTDSCQVFYHIAKALGYTVNVVHVYCTGTGGGHVRLTLKHPKHTGDKWINRDPACVLSKNGKPLTSIWCSDGKLLGTNPKWFMDGVNR